MSQRSALVVEDEVIIAMELEDRLSLAGFCVIGHAATGEQGIAKAREHRPDVILMDIRLAGELDGIDAAQVIRAELGTPVVFISANDDAVSRRRATVVTGSCYLTKPFDDADLRAALATVIAEHSDR